MQRWEILDEAVKVLVRNPDEKGEFFQDLHKPGHVIQEEINELLEINTNAARLNILPMTKEELVKLKWAIINLRRKKRGRK